MKKQNLKSLNLNKMTISNLDSKSIKGGDNSINHPLCPSLGENSFASCLQGVCHTEVFCSRNCETGICIPD